MEQKIYAEKVPALIMLVDDKSYIRIDLGEAICWLKTEGHNLVSLDPAEMAMLDDVLRTHLMKRLQEDLAPQAVPEGATH